MRDGGCWVSPCCMASPRPCAEPQRPPASPAAARLFPTTVLMQLHLREKQELFEANSALRTALRRRGLGDAALEAELHHINMQVGLLAAVHTWGCCGEPFVAGARTRDGQRQPWFNHQPPAIRRPQCTRRRQVDAIRKQEEGVNQVLVLAAQVRCGGWGVPCCSHLEGWVLSVAGFAVQRQPYALTFAFLTSVSLCVSGPPAG